MLARRNFSGGWVDFTVLYPHSQLKLAERAFYQLSTSAPLVTFLDHVAQGLAPDAHTSPPGRSFLAASRPLPVDASKPLREEGKWRESED